MENEKTDILKQFGERVKARREALNLDQIDIAFQMDTSPSYISRIENGRVEPGIFTLCLLTKALKCTSVDLLNC